MRGGRERGAAPRGGAAAGCAGMTLAPPRPAQLYVGLMSGTSLDGIDGVLARIGDGEPPRVLAHVHQGFDARLRTSLVALNRPGGVDELHRAAVASAQLAQASAQVVASLLAQAGVACGDVAAVGAHGQTVRHQPAPGAAGEPAYTLQLLDGARLAELCGIDVVCDFRSRDVAAGGQGAPLVPAFHAARFADATQAVAALNLGGIANLTLLPVDGATTGFDCGPANLLMDAWCLQHTGRPFDGDGRWAAGGRVLPSLLQALLDEPFLALPPPKSTGRELFNPEWLAERVAAAAPAAEARDVMATLAEFTVAAVAQALLRHAPDTRRLLVCGGGACNPHLLQRLQAWLPGVQVQVSGDAGVPPQQVEALAFAWLAARFCERRPGNLPAVTGARGPRVLGALYPA